jgi:DNA-binding transcriptional ArsR family regulator
MNADAMMNAAALDARAEAAAILLKSLANPVRLKMLCAMIDGEQSVGAIAAQVGVRETVISQHLMRLRAEGIVTYRRQGTTVYYVMADGPARAVMRTLYEVFCGAGAEKRLSR